MLLVDSKRGLQRRQLRHDQTLVKQTRLREHDEAPLASQDLMIYCEASTFRLSAFGQFGGSSISEPLVDEAVCLSKTVFMRDLENLGGGA